MDKSQKLMIAAALIVLGIVLIFLPEGTPKLECTSADGPTSGFSDPDQGNCPVSIESYNAYREAAKGPRWLNIGGLVLILGGVGYGGVALLRKPKQRF